jgi:hypothetical protein
MYIGGSYLLIKFNIMYIVLEYYYRLFYLSTVLVHCYCNLIVNCLRIGNDYAVVWHRYSLIATL